METIRGMVMHRSDEMSGGQEEPGAASDQVSVEFELTPEEWVEVSLEHHERQPMNKEAVRRLRLLFGALVVVIAVLITLSGAAGSATLIWLLAGGAALSVFGPLVRSGQRRQLRQFAEIGISNGTFGRHRIELRPEGLLDSTEAYERLTRWPAIERVEQGEHAFLVYVGPNAFLPIPHSAFRDSESLRRFSDAFYALRGGVERHAVPPSDAGGPGTARAVPDSPPDSVA